MLHGGQSLKCFKKWCNDERNAIIMPGYCTAGTVGAKVIAGAKKLDIDGKMVWRSFPNFILRQNFIILA